MSTWRYAILDKGGYFEVCEEFLEDDETHFAYAAEGVLGADSPEELIGVLEMALKDVKQAVKEGRLVKEVESTSPEDSVSTSSELD